LNDTKLPVTVDSTHQAGPMLSWQVYMMLVWLLGMLGLSGWMLVNSWELRQMHRGITGGLIAHFLF